MKGVGIGEQRKMYAEIAKGRTGEGAVTPDAPGTAPGVASTEQQVLRDRAALAKEVQGSMPDTLNEAERGAFKDASFSSAYAGEPAEEIARAGLDAAMDARHQGWWGALDKAASAAAASSRGVMIPIMTPADRSFRVTARVSTPETPGIPFFNK